MASIKANEDFVGVLLQPPDHSLKKLRDDELRRWAQRELSVVDADRITMSKHTFTRRKPSLRRRALPVEQYFVASTVSFADSFVDTYSSGRGIHASRYQGSRSLQVIGGGGFFFMILIGALLCCVCCCIRAGLVRSRNTRRRDAEARRQAEALFGAPSIGSETNRAQESASNRRSGTENMNSFDGQAPPVARATVAGQEIGLNLNDIESIRQFITAESSRAVLEELASALEESRKEYIDSHLIKLVVTNEDIALMNDPSQSTTKELSTPFTPSSDRPSDEKKPEEDKVSIDQEVDCIRSAEGDDGDQANTLENSDNIPNGAQNMNAEVAEPIHPLHSAISNSDDANAPAQSQSANTFFTGECCCTICLEDYKVGDVVCRSKNAALDGCTHRFHQHCISDWLMNHDDCPCCRTNFFNIPPHAAHGRAEDLSAEDTKIDNQSHSSNG